MLDASTTTESIHPSPHKHAHRRLWRVLSRLSDSPDVTWGVREHVMRWMGLEEKELAPPDAG